MVKHVSIGSIVIPSMKVPALAYRFYRLPTLTYDSITYIDFKRGEITLVLKLKHNYNEVLLLHRGSECTIRADAAVMASYA